jgi:hypothetical protein
VLALAGVQVSLMPNWWLNAGISLGWLAVGTVATGLLARHRSVWMGVVLLAGATECALAIVERQAAPALFAFVAAASALAALLTWQRNQLRLAFVGGGGLALASAAISLSFPNRPMTGTWMIPLVILGVPLANLAYTASSFLATLGRGPGQADDWHAYLVRQGASPGGAQRAPIAFGATLALSAVVMALAHPFVSNLMLAALVAAVLVFSRARAIRQAGRLPVLIYAFAGLILVLFVASLRFGFLDLLFSQTLSGYRGWDYFLLPQAFDCLSKGVDPYEPYPAPAECSYGPWATPFVLHPLAAVVPGVALWALPPWTSYWVFVALSLASLFWLYRLFSSLTRSALHRSLIFLVLFANWPLYLMLWLGQTHVFTVLAFGLIEYWLVRQAQGPAGRQAWILAAGILVSLFTKPLVMLFLPALLVAPLTRRPAVVSLLIYAGVSAVFVLVPALNPGREGNPLAGGQELVRFLTSGNMYHWVNILQQSEALHTNHRDIHVLSALLNVVLPGPVVVTVNRVLAALVVGLTAWLAAKPQEPRLAARSLALSGTLIIALYYLAYSFVFEHQYPTLAIVPSVFLLLLPLAGEPVARRRLTLGVAAFAPMLVPTIYRLMVENPPRDILYDFSGETLERMTVYKAFRVIPVLVMFACGLLASRRLRLAGSSHAGLTPAEDRIIVSSSPT